MRELIRSGEMEPRSRVNESLLTERFGISRTPLREAIKILATEGLLELLPNRGARVVSISTREVEEMVEVIAGLEATAGALACARITDAEAAALEASHAALVSAWRAGDSLAYFDHNRHIHEGLVAAAGNAVLSGLYHSVSARIRPVRYTVVQTAEQGARSVGEHERMMELLRARDGSGLGQLMWTHVLGRKELIAAALLASERGRS